MNPVGAVQGPPLLPVKAVTLEGPVAGTHTHVATADARVLPKGTAFVSDLGMVGPVNSIIGIEPEDVVARFLTQTPRRFSVAKDGPTCFNSVLIDIDDSTGRANDIQRVDRVVG